MKRGGIVVSPERSVFTKYLYRWQGRLSREKRVGAKIYGLMAGRSQPAPERRKTKRPSLPQKKNRAFCLTGEFPDGGACPLRRIMKPLRGRLDFDQNPDALFVESPATVWKALS